MPKKFIGRRNKNAETLDNQTKGYIQPYTLEEALEVFINAKIAEGVRERTVDDYKQHVKYLVEYLSANQESLNIGDLTAEQIRGYINYLRFTKRSYEGIMGREKGIGLSINTINMRLRTLRTMCNFWFMEGMLKSNPMRTVKPIKQDQEDEVRAFSDEEVRRILDSYDERNFAEWRDKTLILLLLDTGMRINEAVTLSIENIDFKNASIQITSDIAKNRKAREVPVSREVLKRVQQLYDETIIYFGTTNQVFMNAYGEDFTADAFRRRLHRLGKKLGIEKIHPHRFRHTFIRNYFLNGGDLFTLQKIVDHSDISTTRKYVQMEGVHVKTQHNKFSPVKRYMKKK